MPGLTTPHTVNLERVEFEKGRGERTEFPSAFHILRSSVRQEQGLEGHRAVLLHGCLQSILTDPSVDTTAEVKPVKRNILNKS